MKITEEQFNKLPQLDRIEFRQKRDDLKRNGAGGSLIFLGLFIGVVGYLILISLLVWNISEEASITLFLLVPKILRVGLIMFLFLFAVDILLGFRNAKKVKELFYSYFSEKVEVKIKVTKVKKK